MATDVVLLGKGSLAIRAAGWLMTSPEHELAAIVPVVPEPTWTESLIEWARANRVPYVESGHFRDLATVRAGRVGLAMSVFYHRIFDAAFIETCDRILNLHNAPLPRYRGVSPINWALKNGESHHGVTIHDITLGIDDGPIVAQVTYSIYPVFDEVEDVYARALEFGWTLFKETMPILDRIDVVPQDESAATYYSREENERLGERRGFTRAASRKAG